MLKNKLVVFFVLSHLMLCSQSQITIEIIGGFGISHLSGDVYASKRTSFANDVYTYEKMKDSVTVGYSGGIYCQYKFTDHFGIKTGGYFERSGQNFKNYVQIFDDRAFSGDSIHETILQKRNIKLYYIGLPVLLTYNLVLKEKLGLSFAGGMSFNFLAKYQIDYVRIQNGTIYYWNGPAYTPLDFEEVQYDVTSGNKMESNYSSTYSALSPGSSHNIYPMNRPAFRKFDPELILSAQVQWNITSQFSIPFGLVYKHGFRDIKDLTTEISNGNNSNPQMKYWSGSYNSLNPFLNSSFHFGSGIIYKFASQKQE